MLALLSNLAGDPVTLEKHRELIENTTHAVVESVLRFCIILHNQVELRSLCLCVYLSEPISLFIRASGLVECVHRIYGWSTRMDLGGLCVVDACRVHSKYPMGTTLRLLVQVT